ncbi:hypothetical protein HDV05_007984 [Chytridiales sp. JEL 0842]|nr:hypothetical protein HDV05_007984 [Chytridiales sp. JEL 0842]
MADSNSTFNGTGSSNSTFSSNTTFVDLFDADIYRFIAGIQSDPIQILKELPHVGIFLVCAPLVLIFVVRAIMGTADDAGAAAITADDFAELNDDSQTRADIEAKAKATTKQTETIWQIGVSNKAVSVSEEGMLRSIEFSKSGKLPTVDEIVFAFLKAIVSPLDPTMPVVKPKFAMVLSTRMISEKVVKQVAAKIKEDINVRIDLQENLEAEMPAFIEERLALTEKLNNAPSALAPQVQQQLQQNGQPAAQTGPTFIETPKRACFVCKTEIADKPRQCSACKAIIYCSPECATKDWPQHKVMCPTYKANIHAITEKKFHNLPFEFYNSKKRLDNYNQVAFLVANNIHNVGVYRRLCQCYSGLGFGELSGELLAQTQQPGVKGDAEAEFACSGLPKELFPLGKSLKGGVKPESIDSWEDWYKAVGLPMDSPVAIVFEFPLTLWYTIKHFAPKTMKDGRRKLTIHLLGAEREADLCQLYECLLPLLPKTDIYLHMIGPSISSRLQDDHKRYYFSNNDSTLTLTLTAAVYGPTHYNGSFLPAADRGSETPDLVVIHNAGIFQYETWFGTIKYLSDVKQKTIITEPIETSIEIMRQHFMNINCVLSVKTRLNPFRQPVFQWKKEVNLPGWSNGFITGFSVSE